MTTSHSDCSMDYGVWTENSRGTYNKWDGVARCTTQVIFSWNLTPEAHILPLSSVFWYFVSSHSSEGINKESALLLVEMEFIVKTGLSKM